VLSWIDCTERAVLFSLVTGKTEVISVMDPKINVVDSCGKNLWEEGIDERYPPPH
jgi:hypothetical protein